MKTEARSRLLAFGTNNVSKTSLETELWNTVAEMSPDALKFKRIQGPKDISVWYYDATVLATVPDSWCPVGYLDLKENWDGYTAAEFAVVNPRFLGRGIGMAMYEGVFKSIGHLASSDDLSKGSSALWCKLVTKYRGWLVIPAEESPTGKEFRVKVVDWVKKGGVTYPVVETTAGRKDLRQLTFRGRNHDSQDAARSSYYLIEVK